MTEIAGPSPLGRHCTVCRHAQRAEIELALSTGTTTYRAIARQHDLSRDAVRRHVIGHLPTAAAEAVLAVTPAPALDLAAALADIATHAVETRADADARGDDRVALLAGRHEREARLALADRMGISTADALAEIGDARDLTHAALALIRTRPDAAEALADALAERGRTSWAADIRRAAARTFPETTRLEVSA